jgi:hypothetical protein
MTIDQGMNIAEVESLGSTLRQSADDIARYATMLDKLVQSAPWQGATASKFKTQWWPQQRARLSQIQVDIRGFGQSATNNAADQRRASEAFNLTTPFWMSHLPASFAGGLDRQVVARPEPRIVSFSEFFNRQERLGQNEFEILKVSDHPPKYIVNLPGIEFGWRDPWEQDHLRDLRGASEARLTGYDAYADRVKSEMQRAGIPAGADVMLVGHSAGSIAAMNIAKDSSFNQPGNSSSTGDYHVQVTHVLAAGAGLRDWIDDPPKGTNVLMAINRNDVVADVIQDGDLGRLNGPTLYSSAHGVVNDIFDVVDAHSIPHGDGRLVMEFSANAGGPLFHEYANYELGLNAADGPSEAWMTDAAHMYFAGGGGMQSLQVALPDVVGPGAL